MKLTFEEEGHKYSIDGKEVPSVSKIMECITIPYYEGIDKEIVTKAAYRGIQIHKAIEDLERWGEFEIEDIYKDYVFQYKVAKKLKGFKPIELEQKLTDGVYAGTFDMIAEYEGKTILIDHKTSSKINTTLVQVQFGGYKKLLEANGKKIDKYYCLHLTKTNYKFIEIKPNTKIFDACFKIWKYMKEGK
ncbi:MAG: hypothetical protein KAX49_07355 [Halanaerobiales bacterium]|nr:hypothetical protein [Halanaerobiales bacterium]